MLSGVFVILSARKDDCLKPGDPSPPKKKKEKQKINNYTCLTLHQYILLLQYWMKVLGRFEKVL